MAFFQSLLDRFQTLMADLLARVVGRFTTCPVRRRVVPTLKHALIVIWQNLIALFLVTPFVHLLNQFRVKGRWNVPATGPFLMVANHIGALDPTLISYAAWPRRFNISTMAKAELFDIPVFGLLLKSFGGYPVRRGQRDMAAMNTTIDFLKEGRPVLLFPEGTRSRDGMLGRGRMGVGRIVHLSGTTVLPAVINGTHRLNPLGSVIPRPLTNLQIVFGEPIKFDEYKGVENTPEISREITDRIMSSIKGLIEENFQPDTTPYAWSSGGLVWRPDEHQSPPGDVGESIDAGSGAVHD